MPWARPLLVPLLLLCLAGCRPIVSGDREANPLLGEWQVERTEGPDSGTSSFFILEITEGGARVFRSSEYHAGTYEVAGDQLTLRIKGYSPERYTILRRSGGFDLRHDASQTTFFLVDRNGFDAMGFFGALLLGLPGLALLITQGLALRIYLCSGAWPRVRAEDVSAKVARRAKKHRSGSSSPTGTVRTVSYEPELRFTYVTADGERREGSNTDDHNRKASYSHDAAEALVERWRRDGLEVCYDPRDPSIVFLGREHFPLLMTLVLTALGALLVLGLAAAFAVVAGAAGYEVEKVGTTDWTVIPLLAALPLYLLVARLRGG